MLTVPKLKTVDPEEKKIVLQLNYACRDTAVESFISFRKFITYLEKLANKESGPGALIYSPILERFRTTEGACEDIPLADAEKYNELSSLIVWLNHTLPDETREPMVGLAMGLSSLVFYSTDSFYSLLEPACTGKTCRHFAEIKHSSQVQKEMLYKFILRMLYGFNATLQNEWIHSTVDAATGLYKYYRLNLDSRFIDISAKGELPPLDIEQVKLNLTCEDGISWLEKVLPLSQFRATGLTIITLTDVTARESVEQLGRIIADSDDVGSMYRFVEIKRLLQTIAGNAAYDFGMMPFFSVNDRAAILYENFPYSILVKACWNADISKDDLSAFINHFSQNPDLLTYQDTTEASGLPDVLVKALMRAGICYYMLIPLFYHKKLVGILETCLYNGTANYDATQMNSVKAAIPYIAQLVSSYINRFNLDIDAIIKDKFTNIQPAVQWKFNEVAWHYFRSNKVENKNEALETISFKGVYPLYGAVDIRNSTIERNTSLRDDLQLQLNTLIDILNQVKEELPAARGIEEYLETCSYWQHHLTHFITIEELQFEHFLRTSIHPFLHGITDISPHLSDRIASYFNAQDDGTGIFNKNRRQLEKSIRIINKYLTNYFNGFKEELQAIYPNYFDKFRTDGVEYDIYIGQSIAPQVPFKGEHLTAIRIMQLRSMAIVAKNTNSLIPLMPYPLRTTQLIFVNARVIDISFRTDERRFDVEGAYNIRYHVVKKRIDKVHILNTSERLTQPGKVAIVYFNDDDGLLYGSYISVLQREGIFQDNLEILELEELQGVSGLKALRVGVVS